MFGLFSGNSEKKRQKRYQDLLKQAMQAQRSGNIRLYSELSEQAEGVRNEIEMEKNANRA